MSFLRPGGPCPSFDQEIYNYRGKVAPANHYITVAPKETIISIMNGADLPNAGPLRPISAAISSTCEQLGSRWQSLSRDVDHHRHEIHENASRFLSHVGKVAGDHLRRVQESQQRQQLAGMAVSVWPLHISYPMAIIFVSLAGNIRLVVIQENVLHQLVYCMELCC